jgi:hypothetical protein
MIRSALGTLAAVVLLICFAGNQCHAEQGKPASGALAILPSNPAYFQAADGTPVILVGDYEGSPTAATGVTTDPNYDFPLFFDTLKANGFNVARLWIFYGLEAEWDNETFPNAYHRYNIMPYLRTGPGVAKDGRLKYDLTQFNPLYFERLAAACAAARERGINLQLILIDAWIFRVPLIWKYHVFNAANNINGVDGDPDGTGTSNDPDTGSCSLRNTKVLEAEKSLLAHIIDTVNGFDNVYYEVANENYYNLEWELTMARFVHEYEAKKPKQHLVMPLDLPDHDYGGNQLFGKNGHPDRAKTWKTWDLPQLHAGLMAARSLKQPLLFDPDGPETRDDPVVRRAFWTAFVSGANLDYLDYSMQPEDGGDERGLRRAELRRQLSILAGFTRQVSPWEMHPQDGLVRSNEAYSLTAPEKAVVYIPRGGEVQFDMAAMPGDFQVRWFNPRNGISTESSSVAGGKVNSFTTPDGRDWVLWLERKTSGH